MRRRVDIQGVMFHAFQIEDVVPADRPLRRSPRGFRGQLTPAGATIGGARICESHESGTFVLLTPATDPNQGAGQVGLAPKRASNRRLHDGSVTLWDPRFSR